MSTSDNATIRPCGCLCQLTGASACCSHEDLRSETNVYRTYLDGFGDALVFGSGVKSIHYCPTCRNRLEPDKVPATSAKHLTRMSVRRVKRSTPATAKNPSQARAPKQGHRYRTSPYQPVATLFDVNKKKRSYRPRLNTVEEYNYVSEASETSTANLTDMESDEDNRVDVATLPAVEAFDATRMEWPALPTTESSVTLDLDVDKLYLDGSLADLDLERLHLEGALYISPVEDESDGWDVVTRDSDSIMSWCTMSSQRLPNTNPVTIPSYQDALLRTDAMEDNFVVVSSSKAEPPQKSGLPRRRTGKTTQRPAKDELISDDDEDDLFSLREMAKSTYGGKGRYLFKGHSKGHHGGNKWSTWDKEGASLTKKTHKADLLRQCGKATH
jgi:hypothetical protein